MPICLLSFSHCDAFSGNGIHLHMQDATWQCHTLVMCMLLSAPNQSAKFQQRPAWPGFIIAQNLHCHAYNVSINAFTRNS